MDCHRAGCAFLLDHERQGRRALPFVVPFRKSRSVSTLPMASLMVTTLEMMNMAEIMMG